MYNEIKFGLVSVKKFTVIIFSKLNLNWYKFIMTYACKGAYTNFFVQ